MTSSKGKSPEALEQLASRVPQRCRSLAALLVAALAGCAPKAPVASPRGMSYGVERVGHPFNAVTLVDAARGTTRSAHDVLFEGAPASPALASKGTDGIAAPIIVVGLPRGEGLTLVDHEALVRDGDLAVVEAFVQELRRRGHDARLDRTSTLALPAADGAPTLRLSLWLDEIVIRRAPAHVDASTRAHVWARGAGSEPLWEDDRKLRTREERAPFDVLAALGRELAAGLAKKLVDAPTSGSGQAQPR